MRRKQGSTGALRLAWACALVAILAVTSVGLAVIIGELSVTATGAAADPSKQTIGAATPSTDRSATSASSDLFSGMPLP